MTELAPEQIRQAAQALRAQRPAYESLLQCYEEIFVVQEKCRAELSFPVPSPSAALLDLKEKEASPLIDATGFAYDATAAADLLVRICRILQKHNPQLAADAGRIHQARDAQFQPQALFAALLNADQAYFHQTSHVLGVQSSVLSFVAYCSLRPFLSYCADRLSAFRREWDQGCCPICGHAPGIATLDETGRRHLRCSFCWHRWSFPRSACPFCEVRRPHGGQYLYSESEEELRAELCETCRRYIKTVDVRKAGRPVYPALEQVASLHLDLLARRQGYESGAELPLQDGGRP